MEALTLIEMTILDTSIWIALLNKKDPCNNEAKIMAKEVYYKDLQIFDFIYTEILTVLRNKASDIQCLEFMNFLKKSKINIILSDEKIFNMANLIFFKYPKLSFTDSLLMAAAKVNKASLLTFDKSLQKAWEEITGL